MDLNITYDLNARYRGNSVVYLKDARIDGVINISEAFSNWKSIYNMSMCMTYGKYPSFFV